MKQRLNGLIMRGNTVYYTFQRAKTGQEYLNRAVKKGEDLGGYRVSYTTDAGITEQTAAQFMKAAPKLIANQTKAREAISRQPRASANGKGKSPQVSATVKANQRKGKTAAAASKKTAAVASKKTAARPAAKQTAEAAQD